MAPYNAEIERRILAESQYELSFARTVDDLE